MWPTSQWKYECDKVQMCNQTLPSKPPSCDAADKTAIANEYKVNMCSHNVVKRICSNLIIRSSFFDRIFSVKYVTLTLATNLPTSIIFTTNTSLDCSILFKRKRCFCLCNVHRTKMQIKLRIHTVWSESPLSAWRNLASLVIQNVPRDILIRLRECAVLSECLLGAHVRRYVF